MLDDGQVLTEVAVICQYLGDQKPQAGLVPQSGTMECYRLMEALNFASSEVHKQIGALFNPNLTAEMKEVQLGVIGRRLDALEKLLDNYTVADAYLFTVLNWTNIHKIDLAKWPNIRAYMARIGARPKVQETMRAEGLLGSHTRILRASTKFDLVIDLTTARRSASRCRQRFLLAPTR
jgi:glutathione S-transferase